MINEKVKLKMYQAGVKQWQVAKALGVSESVFTRRLRDELPEEERERVLQLIDEIAGGRPE